MATNQKIDRLADGFVNTMAFRGYTVTKSYDATSDVNLTIAFGTGAFSVKSIARIKPVVGLYGGQANEVDGLGLVQRVYTPNFVLAVFNSDFTTNGASAALISTQQGHVALITAELAKLGLQLQLATKTIVTGVNTGNLSVAAGVDFSGGDFAVKATFDTDIQYPYAGQ
jgi:hypothetical protein